MLQHFQIYITTWLIVEFLCGQRPQSGAVWVSKSGDLCEKFWLWLQRTPVLPSVQNLRGGEIKGNPTGGGEYHLLLAENRAVLLGSQFFFFGGGGENRMTVVVFEKQISLKARTYLAKRLFTSTEVLFLRKNI